MNRRSFFRGLAALAAGCGLVKRTPVACKSAVVDCVGFHECGSISFPDAIENLNVLFDCKLDLASMTSRVDADGVVRVA